MLKSVSNILLLLVGQIGLAFDNFIGQVDAGSELPGETVVGLDASVAFTEDDSWWIENNQILLPLNHSKTRANEDDDVPETQHNDEVEDYAIPRATYCQSEICLDLGYKQDFRYLVHLEDVSRALDEASRSYLYKLSTDAETPEEIRGVLPRCKNWDVLCAAWAAAGWCENNRFHIDVDDMQTDCSLACQSCDQLLYENRCPIDPEAPNAWQPGDLDAFFTNVTTLELYKQWEPKVWSRPALAPGDTLETATYQLGPWIVTLENVFSEEECQKLIAIGSDRGYERSDDWGEYQPDGTYKTFHHDGRTSHHTWCGAECDKDEVSRNILARIESITNIPQTNYEKLQLLRYELGQKYETHHDYDSPDLFRQQGVRMLTVFLYLSDVEEGGGTNFPELDLTFTPQRGRVVLWPNVLNDDPHEWDPATEHQALPVIKGTKYAANAWVHQRNVKDALEHNCYS